VIRHGSWEDFDAAGWDEAYVPFAHKDWLAFMTGHDTFDPEYWGVKRHRSYLKKL